MVRAFYILLKKPLLAQGRKDVILYYFSEDLFLPFTFRPMIHLELIVCLK